MQEAGVAAILYCLVEDVDCIVCWGRRGEGRRGQRRESRVKGEEFTEFKTKIMHVLSRVHPPVVPPPGGVSAEMTPGNRSERKSIPNLW